MAVEKPTGEPELSAYDKALRQRDRLRGLAEFVEIAHGNQSLRGDVGEGLVQLLRDAAEYAADLWETIRRDDLARVDAEKAEGNDVHAKREAELEGEQ